LEFGTTSEDGRLGGGFSSQLLHLRFGFTKELWHTVKFLIFSSMDEISLIITTLEIENIFSDFYFTKARAVTYRWSIAVLSHPVRGSNVPQMCIHSSLPSSQVARISLHPTFPSLNCRLDAEVNISIWITRNKKEWPSLRDLERFSISPNEIVHRLWNFWKFHDIMQKKKVRIPNNIRSVCELKWIRI